MFKDYKALFKQFQDAQEKLWAESTAWTSGERIPVKVEGLLENVNTWAQQAVEQSLELQRAWLDQWAGRANDKKVKPKLFSELNAEAQHSAHRWIEHQQDMWNRWLKFLQSTGTQLPGQAKFDAAFRELTERQLNLLGQWSNMGDTKSLSMKEMSKVADQIAKSLQSSIDTQQKLWSSWFDGFQIAPAQTSAKTTAAPKSKSAKPAAKPAPKPAPKPAAKPTAKPAAKPADDDLKQISGIGPGLETKLKERGYTSLAQLAALSDAEIDELEKTVIRFPGRIKRDDWKGQAQKLIG
jgi:predicted flap endonuclease-1-like 5' DNA nuclease